MIDQLNEAHRVAAVEAHRVAYLEARRRGLSSADAEDVAQEIALRLLLVLEEGKEIRSAGAWARTSAAHLIVDRHRRLVSGKNAHGKIFSLDELEEFQELRQA